MRFMSLTHAVLASFLWCALVFAFVGRVFTTYDTASQELQDSRVQTALSDLRAVFQAEMDKGTTLPQLKKIQARFSSYMDEDPGVLALLAFETQTGKILFSSVPVQIGIEVPVPWREKCRMPGTFFVETLKEKETIGTPLFNAFNENVGCLVAEYKTAPAEKVREQMIKTALHSSVRLSAIGILGIFFLYCFNGFRNRLPPQKLYRAGILIVGFTVLGLFIPSTLSRMYQFFEKDLKAPIALKAKIITRIIKAQTEKAVNSGVPFTSLSGVEPFLEQIRKKNPEILFILLTDKSGRVLFETGSAVQAFDSDPRTGKISLRKGYFNTAEPIIARDASVGWVQIGINERFVREKVF